jgi:hypothetical protein
MYINLLMYPRYRNYRLSLLNGPNLAKTLMVLNVTNIKLYLAPLFFERAPFAKPLVMCNHQNSSYHSGTLYPKPNTVK